MNHKLKTREKIAIFGLVAGFIPVYYQALWIYIFGIFPGHAEAVTEFTKYLPPLFKDLRNSTYLFIVLCLISIVLCSISLKQIGKSLKVAAITDIFVCSLLTLLLLFQLM